MNASIERELASAPPRGVRRRAGRGCQNGCVQLFILPHTIVGIGMLGWALLHLAVLTFGTIVPGTLYDLSTSRGSKGGTTYHALFEYQVAGQNYSAKEQISAKEYGRATRGQPVSVKVLPALPGTGAVMFLPGGKPWGTGIWILPFALFWNGILSVFYIGLYGSMAKEKSLIRRGVPMRGRIVEKDVSRGKTTSYIAHYEFTPEVPQPGAFSADIAPQAVPSTESIGPWGSQPPLPSSVQPSAVQPTTSPRWDSAPQSGITMRGKMIVPKAQYDALNVGDEVTVLYDPRKPKRNTLYACAGYMAV